MLSDKALKKKYLPIFSKEPKQYYPIRVLKSEGYHRSTCERCQRKFWSTDEQRKICGDPSCLPKESFGFIGKSPAANSLRYEEVWQKFSKMFRGLGYVPVKRYPIVARWNPTMEFTNASIAAFQPHVITGETKPPANPLVIPQFCFRTVDLDNVGITGSHNTVFNMIGQHQFVPKTAWNQDKAFQDIFQWLRKGLGLKHEDLVFHEDSWAGGGNVGSCIEFYSRGCELGNQVYMLYEQTPEGVKELDLRVLDMGLGMERNTWFSQGTNTIYDATFPDVLKKLFGITGLNYDKKMIQRYVPHAGMLNIDEVDDIQKAWKVVAQKVGVDVKILKETVLPLAGVYSIAEHARALLVLLADGALPSNTGGGYNIRMMLRRALDFIDKYQWNVELPEVCAWHAQDLKHLFPELRANLENVQKILHYEIDKYKATRQKSKLLVQQLLQKKKNINEKTLLKLYDERGITPELISKEASSSGTTVKIPDNFYSLVTDLHEKKEQKHATTKALGIKLDNVKPTVVKYFDDYQVDSFQAKVLHQKDKYVVLDNTYFYPTSGGQLHDKGTIHGKEIVDVVKQGTWVVHVMKDKVKLPVDKTVSCVIDKKRRYQLAQHHTSAHILNAAARKVLGTHVNQSSAYKDVDKARLDITHYKALSEQEIGAIEEAANKIIQSNIVLRSRFMDRDAAEKQYGVGIYQGGVAPGKQLRIVEIPNVDVEACGGTHLKNTNEAGMIKILKSSKISDSILRIEYVAGEAAKKETKKEDTLLAESAEILNVSKKSVALRAAELFKLWKDIVKKKKKVPKKLSTTGKENLSDKEILEKTAHLLKTQIEHVPQTLKRFKKDLRLK